MAEKKFYKTMELYNFTRDKHKQRIVGEKICDFKADFCDRDWIKNDGSYEENVKDTEIHTGINMTEKIFGKEQEVMIKYQNINYYISKVIIEENIFSRPEYLSIEVDKNNLKS